MLRLYVSTRKGLFELEPARPKWNIVKAHFLGDNVTLSLPVAGSSTVYAALNHGHFGSKLHRMRDGGAWEEIGVPTYPEPQPGEQNNDMWGKPIPWKLDKIWALETGHPSEPGVLWAGTLPGGLFHSTDEGKNWTLVRSLWDHPKRKDWFGGGADLPGIHSVCVDPRDAKHVLAGVSCGGVWGTDDGGANWTCQSEGMWAAYMPPERKFDPVIQDPHRVVQCPAQPDYLWAQHHNGVFRTTDGCKSWHEVPDVPPSVFGFAVAVHPRHPDTAWLVPAIKDERRIPVGGEVVVTRTRDGGKSFDVLRKGLPQEHAYDLTFRHALDVDSTGEVLAFGTTTGALFVSEDQGDSWQTVSAHLPPVYAVRFSA